MSTNPESTQAGQPHDSVATVTRLTSPAERRSYVAVSAAEHRARARAGADAALPDVTVYEAQQLAAELAATRPVTFLALLGAVRARNSRIAVAAEIDPWAEADALAHGRFARRGH